MLIDSDSDYDDEDSSYNSSSESFLEENGKNIKVEQIVNSVSSPASIDL